MVDAGYFRFTHEEVSKDGKNPWTLQAEFDAEIDLDDMVATGNAFVRATEQAQVAEDLAARASQESQAAGSAGGQSLVDGQGRLVETKNALARTEAEVAVDHIFRAMNRAHGAEEEVRRLVERPELDLRHEQNQANALADYTYWNSVSGGLGDALAETIRARHLDIAAADAAATHDAIDGEITSYRRDLASIGDELARLGYDPLSGPLRVFTTPGMADFSAAQLNEELAKDDPDPGIVERYTRNLAGIDDAHEAGPSDPNERVLRDAYGDLTEEGKYVQSFLNGISPEALGQLGQLDDSQGRLSAKKSVANAIQTWMNPEAGGIDPAADPGAVPASLRPFVYDYQETALYDRAAPQFVEELGRFNGFGELMSEATVAAGRGFSQDMAHAALAVQKETAEQVQWLIPGSWTEDLSIGERTPFMPNTGSSGMLQATALHPTASADLLNDRQFREDLLTQDWEKRTGAADLVRSGTIPPPEVAPHTPESRPYVNAAYGVLAFTSEQGDRISGRDPAPLQQAIGDTALTYLDLISVQDGDSTDGPWETPEGKERTINGKPMRHGWDLSMDQRQGLMSFVNGAEDHVREDFFTGVGHWYEQTATQALARDQLNHAHGETDTFKHIGTVQGSLAEVQGRGEALDRTKGQITAMTSLSALVGAASTFAEWNPPTAAVSALGAWGITEGTRHLLPDGNAEVVAAHQQALVSGDAEARVALANAAIAARLPDTEKDANDPARHALTTPGFDVTALLDWADRAAGRTGYLSDMRDAYRVEQGT